MSNDWLLSLSQFRSPAKLILIADAVLSLFLGGRTNAAIILSIVSICVLLGLSEERGAARTIKELLSVVTTQSAVVRVGVEHCV